MSLIMDTLGNKNFKVHCPNPNCNQDFITKFHYFLDSSESLYCSHCNTKINTNLEGASGLIILQLKIAFNGLEELVNNLPMFKV